MRSGIQSGKGSRKEKRKAANKEKRKQLRKELEEKAREEEEARKKVEEEEDHWLAGGALSIGFTNITGYSVSNPSAAKPTVARTETYSPSLSSNGETITDSPLENRGWSQRVGASFREEGERDLRCFDGGFGSGFRSRSGWFVFTI